MVEISGDRGLPGPRVSVEFLPVNREECRTLIDNWGQIAFADPEGGKRHADRCLELVASLGYPPDLYARALTIHASSCRLLGDLSAADLSYSRALRIYETLWGADRSLVLDEADLHRRLAYLRMQQQRPDEALHHARFAVQIFTVAAMRHELGQALAALGWVQLEMKSSRAPATLSHALAYLDDTNSVNDRLAVLYNLAYAFTLFEEPDPKQLTSMLSCVTQARLCARSRRRPAGTRYLAGFRRKTPADALMRFLQGRILVLLGQHEEARRLLETAREDLTLLEMPFDVAAASLELAECYLWLADHERWPRIETLCREVLTLLASVPQAAEAIAAYQLLERATAGRSLRALRKQLVGARQKVGRRT